MTIDELKKNKYTIVTEFLMIGGTLDYNNSSVLYRAEDGYIYQVYLNEQSGKTQTLKSSISLNNYIKYINNLPNDKLKNIFKDLKLIKLSNNIQSKK